MYGNTQQTWYTAARNIRDVRQHATDVMYGNTQQTWCAATRNRCDVRQHATDVMYGFVVVTGEDGLPYDLTGKAQDQRPCGRQGTGPTSLWKARHRTNVLVEGKAQDQRPCGKRRVHHECWNVSNKIKIKPRNRLPFHATGDRWRSHRAGCKANVRLQATVSPRQRNNNNPQALLCKNVNTQIHLLLQYCACVYRRILFFFFF